MKCFYTLSFFNELHGTEKLLFLVLALALFLLLYDVVRKNLVKKHNKRMLKEYLYIKDKKWNDVIYLLTTSSTVTSSEIKDTLQVDISKFDSKYRDIFYYELRKIKQSKDINPLNWDLFIKILYNK